MPSTSVAHLYCLGSDNTQSYHHPPFPPLPKPKINHYAIHTPYINYSLPLPKIQASMFYMYINRAAVTNHTTACSPHRYIKYQITKQWFDIQPTFYTISHPHPHRYGPPSTFHIHIHIHIHPTAPCPVAVTPPKAPYGIRSEAESHDQESPAHALGRGNSEGYGCRFDNLSYTYLVRTREDMFFSGWGWSGIDGWMGVVGSG